MDIGFSPEQELLRDSARKFLDAECPMPFVRQRMAEEAAVTPEFWGKLAAQGWLGITYPEEEGGSGLGLVDLVVLMEEMGAPSCRAPSSRPRFWAARRSAKRHPRRSAGNG